MLMEIPEQFKDRFDSYDEEFLASALTSYVIYDANLVVTPAIWQDAEIHIRYLKRDVWHLTQQQLENAKSAKMLYCIKYIMEHLKKMEIVEILNALFDDDNIGKNRKTINQLLEKKFLAPVGDLIYTKEKKIVTVNDLKKIDELFAYPAWLEFDSEARQAVVKKIMNDEFTDEQISYILGATDSFSDYVELYPAIKHVLLTTKNAQTFWVAGDIFNMIWMAAPDDEKSKKWFDDEIFEIFWPRVGNVWPILNQYRIDFEESEESKIMKDAIGWLFSLSYLYERLPELKGTGVRDGHEKIGSHEELFVAQLKRLDDEMIRKKDLDLILDLYFELTEMVEDEKELVRLKPFFETLVKELSVSKDSQIKHISNMVKQAFASAEKHLKNKEIEREKIGKELVGKKLAKK